MANKQRYTPAQVIAALQETRGMMFLAAKRLGCDHETILNYCKRYPAVEAAKQSHRGEMVDLAELKLLQSIQNGEAWGISLCLKTIGKERGYVERHEQTGKDGTPLDGASGLAALLEMARQTAGPRALPPSPTPRPQAEV